MNKQTGFTLIELVVVIVILGILAATALPKFVDLGGDARAAMMKGVEGSMRAANAMIYAKAASAGQLGAAGTVTIPGATTNPVNLVYGFASNRDNLDNVMDLTPATDFTLTATAIQHARATTPANCSVTYTPAALVGGVVVPPSYAIVTSGC